MIDEVASMGIYTFQPPGDGDREQRSHSFKKSILAGTIIGLLSRVANVGNTSMKVSVEIYLEQIYSERRDLQYMALSP